MTLLRAISPIGIDVGARAVAAAQLSRKRGQWRLENAGLIGRPPGGAPDALSPSEAQRLADILSRQGFVGRDIVLAMPDSKLMLSVLDLPPRDSGAPLADLARAEMARTHKRDAGSFEMACWDLPAPLRATDGTHVMAVACSHDDAAAVLDPVESGGLRVAALDIRAWAMVRACERPLGDSTGVAGLLEVGETRSVLALVRSGIVVYERILGDAGLGPLRERLARSLSLEPEVSEHLFAALLGAGPAGAGDGEVPPEAGPILQEHAGAIARELQTALSYAVHRYGGQVARVLLHGPGARLRGLAEALAAELGAPAEPVLPGDLVDCAPQAAGSADDPGLGIAIGLALHRFGRAA